MHHKPHQRHLGQPYRAKLLLVLLLLFSPAQGLQEEGASGLVLGPSMSFQVTAPPGWILDDETCVQTRYGSVIYPVGADAWGDKGPSITNSVYDRAYDYEAKLIAAELANPRKLAVLTTSDGQTARVFEDSEGKFGRIAYIETPESVCRISLTAPDAVSLAKSIPVFEAVVGSYRYFGPESGVHLAHAAIQGLLLRTAEVSDRSSPPKGWARVPGKPGITVYQRAEGDSFGIAAVYASKPSEGDPQADYEIAWRQLAFTDSPAPTPKSEIHHSGWQMRTGEKTELVNGKPTTTLVTVYSGYGKYTAVLVSYNDQSYRPNLQDFLNWGIAPAGSINGGDWTFRDTRIYDRQIVNGKRVDTEYATRSYRFGRDTYTFEGSIALKSGELIKLEESGTLSVTGNKLTLRGQGGTREEARADGVRTSEALPPWERVYTFRLVTFEVAMHGPFLVLEGVEENEIDGAFDSRFPKAFVYVLGFH